MSQILPKEKKKTFLFRKAGDCSTLSPSHYPSFTPENSNPSTLKPV
jgi:hypothetical protein